MSDAIIHRFCISHAKPLLPQSWYDDCIALGEFDSNSAFHVRQLDPFWHMARPLAYGAAGMHVLPRAMQKVAGTPALIEVSSFRKRILPRAVGRDSPTYQSMREISLIEARADEELARFLPKNSSGFLVARPRIFQKSVRRQYAAAHHRRDIVDYLSLAIELGVLEKAAASELASMRHFIPGGLQLGIYPSPWLLEVLPQIELVSREFLCRYRGRISRYDRIQIRAIGFLDERLGSYLVIRHLRELFPGEIPGEVFGYMSTIVNDGASYSPSGAD